MGADAAAAGRAGVADLNGATLQTAPACCAACTWWLAAPGRRAPERARWAADVERRFGPWGKLYYEDGRLAAFMQYGPVQAFPRASRLPAGPPSADAVLITCALVLEPGAPWALQRLLLACIGETRDAARPAIEAFAVRGDGAARAATGHHTLFSYDGLAELGFRPLRSSGRVVLMRLEVGGIVPVEEGLADRVERAWAALRTLRRAPSLSPP